MYLFLALSFGGSKSPDEKRRDIFHSRPACSVGFVQAGVRPLGVARRRPKRCPRLVDKECVVVPFSLQSDSVAPTSFAGCTAAGAVESGSSPERSLLLSVPPSDAVTLPDEFCELRQRACPEAPGVRA